MTHYRERLWPSHWIFLAVALVIPASLLVFLPINVVVGIATAIVLYLGCVGILIAASPVIEVTGSHLVAGRAQLPLPVIATISSHEGEDARLERGPRLDARAWLLIRGWIDPVVKVTLNDPEDPTPYWIVSTRRPVALAEAITTAKTASGSGTAA